jgi:pimeloyl-ACP methyl ester carboxylesterase
MPRLPSLVEVGAGPPVLAIHGQPGLGADWAAVAARLARDHLVLAPDRPGYGNSGEDADSLAGNVEALAGLLRRRGLAPATVVAHSYGGAVAVLLAERHPELVSGLVLVASVGQAGSLNRFDRFLALPLVGEILSVGGLYAVGQVLPLVRRRILRAPERSWHWLATSLPDDHYRQVASARREQVWRSFISEQRILLAEIGSVETALAGIRVPTVVVTGTWDVVVPPSVASSLAATIPGAELLLVARTGHFLPRDRPGVVAGAVRRVAVRTGDPVSPREPPGPSGA